MRSEEGRTGTLFVAAAGVGALVALGLVGVLTRPGVLAQPTPASSTTSDASPNVEVDLPAPEDAPDSCPITVPGDGSFTPASEAPEELPSVYDSVWYGTPDLWTKIDEKGEVWRDLPVGEDGSLTQKWLWWSDHLSSKDSAEITITADHLDGTAPTVRVSGPGGASISPSSPSFGTFIVTSFELPERGCWEITAHYRGASSATSSGSPREQDSSHSLLVAALALAACTHCPAAADVHAIAESATADCDAVDAWIEAPRPEITVVLDVVAIPASPRYPYALQTANAHGGLWEGTKWGLFFRNGASPFVVIVPEEIRDRVFIGDWGTETNTWEGWVPGCERTEEWVDDWLIFGGSVVVREPECIPLSVTRGSRTETVTIGVGTPCPGQGPPPEPISPSP